MTNANMTAVRFDHWVHPDMIAFFEREPDIDLITLQQDDETAAWAAFETAHAYQISAAKDELALKWYAHAPLLERAPNLLCISSGGAGYDTVDVPACTAAGVLVVNQAGGNAQSVAEHTLGLILGLTKRIAENDRVDRAQVGFGGVDFDVVGQVDGIDLDIVFEAEIRHFDLDAFLDQIGQRRNVALITHRFTWFSGYPRSL